MRQFIATYKINGKTGGKHTIYTSIPYEVFDDAYKHLIDKIKVLKQDKLPIERLAYARVEFTEIKTKNILDKSYQKMYKNYLSDMY